MSEEDDIALKVKVIHEDILGAGKLAADVKLFHLASTLYFLGVAMQSKHGDKALQEICAATHEVMKNYRDG